MTILKSLREDFSQALEKFRQVLAEDKNEFIRDAAIKRFEIVFDLAWRTLKAALEEKGLRCSSPKECFREAYKQKLINYEDKFLDLISERNYVVHIYSEKLAERIFKDLPSFLKIFEELKDIFDKE